MITLQYNDDDDNDNDNDDPNNKDDDDNYDTRYKKRLGKGKFKDKLITLLPGFEEDYNINGRHEYNLWLGCKLRTN